MARTLSGHKRNGQHWVLLPSGSTLTPAKAARPSNSLLY